MRMVRELSFFLGFQIKQLEYGGRLLHTTYKSMIGSLLYLTTSHHALCFIVGVCARYQTNP
ncbi:Copia protein [Gossypium australe]|uniref:Copia protein n=1 Tax=Gossypium australe TaxID=47621 RepID=A0A5B6V0I2_9ROSI|nr:Copia protein [Gossypium australe]